MRRDSLALLLSAVLLSTVARAQEFTFRSNAEFVALDVQVLSGNNPVLGLKPEDFLIWDNGVPQQIANFGTDDVELDVILLLDTSGSTGGIRSHIQESAAEALSHLYFRDRVGLVIFNFEPYLVTAPTWDRLAVLRRILDLPRPRGLTEINSTVRATAWYLRGASRPGARRAIVVLTDNVALRTTSDERVRNDLWESDAVLNAILFKSGFSGGTADIRKFAKATGGEVLKYEPGKLPLVELFQRMRKRYLLLYHAPVCEPGTARSVRVALAPATKARLEDVVVRTRTGYISGQSGSEIRRAIQKLR